VNALVWHMLPLSFKHDVVERHDGDTFVIRAWDLYWVEIEK